jgi:hypothetical protein
MSSLLRRGPDKPTGEGSRVKLLESLGWSLARSPQYCSQGIPKVTGYLSLQVVLTKE